MSREREDHGLSTADLAAAADTQQRQHEVPAMPRNEMDGRDRGAASGTSEQLAPLFDHQRADDMRMHWANIQAGFVDDPRRAVQQADELVAQVMKDLAEGFSRQRDEIEAQATAGGDQQASTENLRVALRRYRSFFERLLNL
jgi:hypothetical protein